MSSYTAAYYHIVFGTKNRQPLIHSAWEHDLFAYIGGIVRSMNCSILAINGVRDHIHILLILHKDRSLSEVVRTIKSNSSKWVRENKQPQFLWQRGYSGFSIGYKSVSKVEAYIKNQKEHHRTVTFEEEYLKLLKAYNIEYDEKFVWG